MNPLSLDLATLRQAYLAGLSPWDLLSDIAARIERIDDPGVFLSRTSPDALRSALESLGPLDPVAKPLWGVPFAVKDNIDCAGLPTTAGCPDFTFHPTKSAEVVLRLVGAGAIFLGKTNLDQFATGLVGTRTPYPVPRNSFDPALVPGGSSSGSAIAVAQGLVSFALGTDTAGSGRVPAGLNNIVGLKPTLGAVSVRGVLPACKTLDCVSIFALTVPDAWDVLRSAAGYDPADPFSRQVATAIPASASHARTLGVPDSASRIFFGDTRSAAAFDKAIDALRDLGHTTVPVDLASFFDVARLLYEGPWVAERYQAIRSFIETSAHSMHPTTLALTQGATAYSAADTFAGLYRLAALRRATEPVWSTVDALVVPTYPRPVTLAEIAEDPIAPNAGLGTYTNFVNLLDLAALAVPGPFRSDGQPAGITLIAPAGSDGTLAMVGAAFHASVGTKLGATQSEQPRRSIVVPAERETQVELCVVGAHLTDMPLNRELVALNAILRRAVRTRPDYALYALPNTTPRKPGLVRVADGRGHAIDTEVWAMSPEAFGRLVAAIPAPLGIGTIRLEDGTSPKGFLCEGVAVARADDVSRFGGWRRYVAETTA